MCLLLKMIMTIERWCISAVLGTATPVQALALASNLTQVFALAGFLFIHNSSAAETGLLDFLPIILLSVSKYLPDIRRCFNRSIAIPPKLQKPFPIIAPITWLISHLVLRSTVYEHTNRIIPALLGPNIINATEDSGLDTQERQHRLEQWTH